MRTLVKELVGAEAMTKIIIPPWLTGSSRSCFYGIVINENLDGSDIAGQVPGISVSLGQFRQGYSHVILSGGRRTMPQPSLQFK